jgi:hypothetical protein
MTPENRRLRDQLVHDFSAATEYMGGCTQHERDAAHYQCGRKAGIGQALELLDTFLRSEDGRPARRRPVEEIVAAVESAT